MGEGYENGLVGTVKTEEQEDEALLAETRKRSSRCGQGAEWET